MDVEVRQCVVKGDAAVAVRRSSADGTEVADARVYAQLYCGDILVARVTLPSCLEEVRQLRWREALTPLVAQSVLSSGLSSGGRGRSTRGAGRSGARWFEIV